MAEYRVSLPDGLSVDLMVGPEDIRPASIRQQNGNHISIRQTNPPLKAEYIGHIFPLTFVTDQDSSRIGYKIKVLGLKDKPDTASSSLIEAELMDAIEKYELRKYPRFNPKLFDHLQIFFGDTPLELTDVSSGGARGACQSEVLTTLKKGDLVMLDISLGTISYRVKAEIMRIRSTGAQKPFYEIAIAFMEWDKNFLDARQTSK